MEIYIKGIQKMPKSCHECFAEQEGSYCGLSGSYGKDTTRFDNKRRDDCQLVSIQVEHGRLVNMGKWIKMSDADGVYYCCSECGKDLYREWSFNRSYDLFPRKKSIDKTKYCPNCGARMDEVEQNDFD